VATPVNIAITIKMLRVLVDEATLEVIAACSLRAFSRAGQVVQELEVVKGGTSGARFSGGDEKLICSCLLVALGPIRARRRGGCMKGYQGSG
jgi:hypothetical protein